MIADNEVERGEVRNWTMRRLQAINNKNEQSNQNK